MALQRKEFSTEIGGKKLTLEISSLAEQANAAVLVKYGETAVLATVVMSKKDVATDYLPLKVDYEEKFYAAGKIIGSRFVRREGRASEEAVLAGRLVDRTIRPLFDSRLRREIQVVVTTLAIDEENDPEFLGLVGASTALGISDVPWGGPVGGVRVVSIDGKIKINPDNSETLKTKPVFDAFFAGPKGRINMIELQGIDAPEDEIIEGVELAGKEIDKIIDFEEKIIKEIGKKKSQVTLSEYDTELRSAVDKFLDGKLEDAVYRPNKIEYISKIGELKGELIKHVSENIKEADLGAVDFLFEEALDKLVHKNILEKDRRPDGRKLDEVRGLDGEVGLFPRTHGSALFIRGNTQALGITTLAPPGAEQMIETMETTGKRRFMLHYNFPPYSVGEIGSFRGPGRRDIGHGNLARKAVEAVIPPKEEFPYTIRVVSEIMSSNGSSSMASVSAAILSLMDAGVPIKKTVAGIAMGLMLADENNYKILTDIQGPEDHHGDMDFKIAGTADGINALQLDVKFQGLTSEIIRKTLEQAKKARMEILELMKRVIHEPRKNISPFVPTIRQLKINKEKIGLLIGPGGKTINGFIERYGLAGIDVEEDGAVFVSGPEVHSVEEAVAEIKALTREYKVGEMIEGKIIKTLDFGAIVDLGGNRDGMIHVSELKEGFVKTVQDVVKVGDFVRAKIIRVDEDGRIGLSMKQLQE